MTVTGGRTPEQFAIEFGEYLAQSAEHFLERYSAPERMSDFEDVRHLRSAIYEFRKRASRSAHPAPSSDDAKTKETPAQEAVAWRVKRPRNPSWWFCETLVVAQRIVDKNPGSVIESLYLHPAPSSDDATSRLRITDEVVEIAAQAAYEVTQQKATRWHAGTQLERFVPWHEVSMDWRDDYKTTIRAALAAASGQPHE